jgi:hypothetical protein
MAEQPARPRTSNGLASNEKTFFIEDLEFEGDGRHWIAQGAASMPNDIKPAIGDVLQ